MTSTRDSIADVWGEQPAFKYMAVQIRKFESSEQIPVQQGYTALDFVDRSDGALEKIASTQQEA